MLPHPGGRPCSLVRAPDGLPGNSSSSATRMAGTRHRSLTWSRCAATSGLRADRPRRGARGGRADPGWKSIPGTARPVEPEVAGRLVFDLDPAPDVSSRRSSRRREEMRGRLEALGLHAFCKTTGGKGLHVVTPLLGGKQGLKWPAGKDFAHAGLCPDGRTTRPSDTWITCPSSAAHGQDLPRLPAQRSPLDGGGGTLEPGARRRTGLHAARLGRRCARAWRLSTTRCAPRRAAAEEGRGWDAYGPAAGSLPDGVKRLTKLP